MTYLIWKYSDLYRKHPELYGCVTYVHSNFENHKATLKWSHDWRSRDDLEMWIFQNIALAQAKNRNFEELISILRKAYTILPDHTYGCFLVYFCLFEPDLSIVRKYSTQLRRVSEDRLGNILKEYKALAEVRILANGLDGAPSDPPKAMKQWRGILKDFFFDSSGMSRARLWVIFKTKSLIKEDSKTLMNH
ncbi:MAG: hypothetical protein ACPGN3_10920 [Opitutales bacterium]